MERRRGREMERGEEKERRKEGDGEVEMNEEGRKGEGGRKSGYRQFIFETWLRPERKRKTNLLTMLIWGYG